MATTQENLINFHGSNPQLHDFMTLQILARTRQRVLYRYSNGYSEVIQESQMTGLEDRIIQIPIPYLARPDLLQQSLFQVLGASSIVPILSVLISYAIEIGMFHVAAEFEFVSDRFLSDEELSDWVEMLHSEDEEEDEEEERRLAMADTIEKLKEDAGFDCDGSEEGELGTCAVCLEDLSGKLVRMPCAHLYHESCIVPWLERKNSCPMCRRELLVD